MSHSNTIGLQKDKHQEALNKLNSKQQKAVHQTEGPVLVLAGPGTGKTEVLAVRIGQILKVQDINPSNILCMTYSNAGVDAMRKRLKQLIGETADQIAIYTYHSFSNKLITEQHSNFYEGKTLISEAQRNMLIEKLIYDHLSVDDPTYLKPVSSPKIKNYANIFSTLKQEDLNREEIMKHAEHCINNILPFEEKYLLQKGGLNVKGRELKEKIQRFARVITAMYEDYCAEIEKRNKFEFEDMLNEAIILLTENSEKLQSLQEKYQYILVDEFQDTNRKQLALLDKLTSGNMEPNLFVVGDDDQCIYRFQGASRLNFDWMKKKFNRLETIVLDINYRSTPVLLQEAFKLISVNEERQPEKDKPLVSGNEIFNEIEQIKPTIQSYENAEQQAATIAKSIVEKMNGGVQLNEIAILSRKHSDLALIKKWLQIYKVPYQVNQSWVNLLETTFGKRLFNLLQFIRCHGENNNLAEGFLVQFCLTNKDSANTITKYLSYKLSNEPSFYDWLKNNNEILTDIPELVNVIDPILEKKNSFITEEQIIACELLAEREINPKISDDEKNAWKEFVASFIETDRLKSIVSLADLLWYHEQNRIAIRVKSNNEDENKNAVTLSSIHGSKGLEYNIVYLISQHSNNWEDKSSAGNVKVPDLLNRYIVPEGDSLDDMRRVIYVACTRAKTELHVSLYRKTESDKDLSISKLFNTFRESENEIIEQVSSFELPKLQAGDYTVSGNEELMELIKNKINDFEISPSSTATWEKCQNEFFFTNMLKLPGTGAEAMAFGNIVHNVLQHYAENISKQHDPNYVENLIDTEIYRSRHQFHSTHVEKYKQYAKWLLPQYISKFPIDKKPTFLEGMFHVELMNGVKLKGKLDRVELDDKAVKVIDYKTGIKKGVLKTFKNHEDPGTQYWRQAMIYSMLMIDNFKEANTFSFEFHYPELKNGIYDFDYEKNTGFEEWLGNIWNKSKNLEFQNTCLDPECIYCKRKLC